MVDYISVTVSGSADCNSELLKNLFIGNDKNVKVRYVSNGSKYHGRYIISTSYSNANDLDILFNRIRGIASHCIRIASS